ncbi:MAG: CHAD domain-containing protein [Gallionella sp.]|nr:CHAD domain-containing protein [Gallionella sp.]
MSTETELKLRITPQSLARLKRHPLLKQHQLARPVTRRLYNVYYDTPKLELKKSAVALRLRRAGGQWLQTLKGGGSVQAGLHRRDEWEMPVSGEALDFSAPQAREWDAYLPASLRKKLQPVFVTDFSRSARVLAWHGAQIELCMDQGEVRTGQHHSAICEVELELKSGEPQQVFELALVLLDSVPFELEAVSKAEQGYRLLAGYTESPVKASVPVSGGKDGLAQVLQQLIWSCLSHLQGNLRGAMQSDDAEYLHQMRVALRRLRVVLRMAENLGADEVLGGLSRDVAALCVALGRTREWDVFVGHTLLPLRDRMPGHAGLQALLAEAESRRDACYAELRGEKQAVDLQKLLLRIAIWMSGSYWHDIGGGLPRARDFAARRLERLSRRINRAALHLPGADADRLHALRILAKKLRYSAEFFAGLFDKRAAKRYLSTLSAMQEVLGQINDVAVAHRLLDSELAAALPQQREALALAKGWIAHDLSRQFVALRRAVKRLSAQEPFWGLE